MKTIIEYFRVIFEYQIHQFLIFLIIIDRKKSKSFLIVKEMVFIDQKNGWQNLRYTC